jgi:hypothetical protein
MLRRWLAGGSSVIAAATVVACSSSPGSAGGPQSQTAGGSLSSASGRASADEPSRAAPSSGTTPHGGTTVCGTVPTSSGPLAHLAHLAIKAPATASTGQSIPVSATVTSRSAVPRVITTPATSSLLVVQGARVAGRAQGGSAPDVPLQITAGVARPAQAIPEAVRLAACGPDPKTDALAPGRYAVVAVLNYQLDSLNAAPAGGALPPTRGSRSFALVSAPAPITVG